MNNTKELATDILANTFIVPEEVTEEQITKEIQTVRITNKITDEYLSEIEFFAKNECSTAIDVDDRVRYDKLDRIRKDCKNFRITISKVFKSRYGYYKKAYDQWRAQEKEIIERLTSVETMFKARLSEVDEFYEQLAQQQKEAETAYRKEVESRWQQLLACGKHIPMDEFEYLSVEKQEEYVNKALLEREQIEAERAREVEALKTEIELLKANQTKSSVPEVAPTPIDLPTEITPSVTSVELPEEPAEMSAPLYSKIIEDAIETMNNLYNAKVFIDGIVNVTLLSKDPLVIESNVTVMKLKNGIITLINECQQLQAAFWNR